MPNVITDAKSAASHIASCRADSASIWEMRNGRATQAMGYNAASTYVRSERAIEAAKPVKKV